MSKNSLLKTKNKELNGQSSDIVDSFMVKTKKIKLYLLYIVFVYYVNILWDSLRMEDNGRRENEIDAWNIFICYIHEL